MSVGHQEHQVVTLAVPAALGGVEQALHLALCEEVLTFLVNNLSSLFYSALAFSYSNSSQSRPTTQYADKAYALRDSVSERERLVILDSYHLFVTGELDKRIDEAELRKQLYPRDYSAFTNLS